MNRLFSLPLAALLLLAAPSQAAPADAAVASLEYNLECVICAKNAKSVQRLVENGLGPEIDSERHAVHPASAAVMKEAAKTHFVFVTGFMGDFSSPGTYFQEWANALGEKDLKAASVTILKPPSYLSISDNADGVLQYIKRSVLQNGDKRKVVLVGHSMGGPTVALALFRSQADPALRGRIAAAVSIQGAHGGSDEFSFFRAFNFLPVSPFGGVASLAPGEPNQVLENTIRDAKLTAAEVHALSQRLFYIPTSTTADNVMGTPLMPGHMSYSLMNKTSDGVLLTERQTNPLYGRILGKVPLENVAHLDSVMVNPWAKMLAPWWSTENQRSFPHAMARVVVKRILGINLKSSR